MTGRPWRKVPGGLELRLRVTPRSRSDEVAGLHSSSDGTMSLMVKVRAIPDKGAANAAVIETLAGSMNWPKSRISLTAGSTGRAKTVFIAGDAETLEKIAADLARETEPEKA